MQRNKFIELTNKYKQYQFDTDKRNEYIDETLNSYRWKYISTTCIEELSELQQEITKSVRGWTDNTGLLEEIADVYISLQLLRKIHKIEQKDLDAAIDAKLSRNHHREERKKNFKQNARRRENNGTKEKK